MVEAVNQDPRRGVGHERADTAGAGRAGRADGAGRYSADSDRKRTRSSTCVPPPTFHGGTHRRHRRIHPDNRDRRCARCVRSTDVGGVDFISPNIAESYKSIGGGICEVNAAPGFRMHVAPSEGTPRDAAGPVIDMLFPQGTPSRVPIAAITGTNGKTTTARMLAHITKMAGYTPGLTTTDGVYIDGQRTSIRRHDRAGVGTMVFRSSSTSPARTRARRDCCGPAWRPLSRRAVLNIPFRPLGRNLSTRSSICGDQARGASA